MLQLTVFFSILNGLVTASSIAEHAILVQNDAAFHVKFPKLVLPSEKMDLTPPGHMQELGMQSPPIGQIPEYFHAPTPRELWDTHVKLYRPAVYRGLLNGSPAMKLWARDEYLVKEYGDQEVLVEKKFEDRKTEPKRMTIEGFLQQYKQHNWYVVTILPNSMRKDLRVPKPLMCSTFLENLQELNLWIGTHGTRSKLHYDADNIMHCLVAGRKDWILINPKYVSKLDKVLGSQGQGSGFSHLDPDAIDLVKNPEMADIGWEYVTLYAGDCLYLPPQYWHQVRSHNRSVSATYLFFPRDTFSDRDCENVDLEGYKKLSDVYVYWTYEKGQETVDMGYQNPVNIRSEFLNTYNITGVQSVTWKEFLYMTYLTSGEQVFQAGKALREFFNSADTDNDQIVTMEELEKTDMEIWKRYCRNTDSPHGPTKSELNVNAEKTNASAAFNPRTADYYEDIKRAREFLSHIIEREGHRNDILTYPRFVSSVQIGSSDPASAFLLVDVNMDGVLRLEEVEKVSDEAMRKFSRMRYAYKKNPDLSGGGLYEDEQEQGLESVEKEDGNVEFPDDFSFMQDVLERGMEWAEAAPEKRIDQAQFNKLFDDAPADNAKNVLDLNFLFKLFGRSSDYVTVDDFDELLHSPEPNEQSEDDDDNDDDFPVVKKDRSAGKARYRRPSLISSCEAMGFVHRLITASEIKKKRELEKSKSKSDKDEL